MEGEFRKVAARTSDSHQERTLMLVNNEKIKILLKRVAVMLNELGNHILIFFFWPHTKVPLI